ncbi:FHA domain-containing protein [Tundrisphaera sp. TA3]|uniref:FHA domain-containing protein n=1 Tax=Tundrisphaera sp. TA3 TaxID=3435775 RepID=UPI003EBF4AFC
MNIPRTWRANGRQAHEMSIAGALGGVFGLFFFVELVHASSIWLRDALAGATIGGAIGFFIAAAGPFRDAAWLRLSRDATRGVLLGALGGALGLVLGEVILDWLRGGLIGRSLSWAILGLGIGAGLGLGPGWRPRIYHGIVGGAVGGLVGGWLFEALRARMGNRIELGQGLGIALLGGGIGLGLALTEQVLRRSWVQVVRGRQEGRAYLLTGKKTTLGLDERAGVGLFGDATVARQHAEIAATGKDYILTSLAPPGRTRVNGEVVHAPWTLQDGDRIELGQTLLLFRRR